MMIQNTEFDFNANLKISVNQLLLRDCHSTIFKIKPFLA